MLLIFLSPLQGPSHELPTFPRIRLVSVLGHPWEPASRILAVEVLDPQGRAPLPGAHVLVTGIEREAGSRARLREHWLAPTPQPGIYQGRVTFPAKGVWQITVTVKGRHVGEAHFEVSVRGGVPRAIWPGDQPELFLGWRGWLVLVLDWGHLLGFGLWLGVTALALVTPHVSPRATVALTWAALVIGVGTGFNKMEYGTPFARGLSLLSWELPRVFFAREYVYTLAAKHVVILGAVVVTVLLTRQAWRRIPDGRDRPLSRGLLVANLFFALAVGGAAAVLGLLHAIVLHFA